MMSAAPLWWLALASLLVPILLHRQRRERIKAKLLATARFLPLAAPRQSRVWRLEDLLLLALRCLLLAAVVAWLADPVLPWRGDTILVVHGTDQAWADQQAAAAGMRSASRIETDADVLSWFAAHEGEWRRAARILVLGDASMPAHAPGFGHAVELRSRPAPGSPKTQHIAIYSEHAAAWKGFFAAAATATPISIDPTAGPGTDLIIWDQADAPAPALRAPLWWTTGAALGTGGMQIKGMRVSDTPRGRVWMLAQAPKDADAAMALYQAWQTLHLRPAPYAAPTQAFPAVSVASPFAGGALRTVLAWAVLILFALERVMSHVRRA